MKILIITNLFPNSQEPTRGMYNKQQFAELAKLCELKVVAPVPWHHFSKLPFRETIYGFDVYHPRYFMIPKIGLALYGVFFFLSIFKKVKKIDREFKSDTILATWAYPDAVGSFLCAKILKKPFLVKVHGSDINLYVKHRLRRAQIVYVLSRSDKVITVSSALKQRLVEIGVPAEKIQVIPNGVDTKLFKPLDQVECRKKLGLPLDKKIILYAGNFAQVKGVDILIEAFGEMVRPRADTLLLLVGDGPLETMLRSRVRELGIEGNVIFSRLTTHDSLPFYMNACDVFCLPSRDEGCPNVVLEALACGRPVVASKVGGVPELINSQEVGILVEPMNVKALAEALLGALERRWNCQGTREGVLKFGWKDSAVKLKEELGNSVHSFDTSRDKKLKIIFITWQSHGTRSDNIARLLGGESIKVYHGIFGSNFFTILLKYFTQSVETLFVLLKKKPRVVFFMTPPIITAFCVYLYCKISGAKFIIDAHTEAILSKRWRLLSFLHRFFSRKALTTIVTNGKLKEIVNSWRAHATIMGDLPVEFKKVDEVKLRPGFNVVLINSFALDEPLLVFLEAAEKLPEINFYVTGNTKCAYRVFNNPDFELKKERKNVIFTDFLSESEYAGLIKAGDVAMTLTNDDHTMQRGLYEALSLGKPLITSDWKVLRDSFYKGAIYVDNSVEGIVNAILQMKSQIEKFRQQIFDLRQEKTALWERKFSDLIDFIAKDFKKDKNNEDSVHGCNILLREVSE